MALALSATSAYSSSTSSFYSSSSDDSLLEDFDSELDEEPATAAASTSTLVNEQQPLHFMFSRNSVTHATLLSPEGPAYRINTNSGLSRTKLVDLTDGREQIVATVKRRDILPDVVVFAHRLGKSVRVNKWLQQPKNPNGRSVLHTLYGHFTWRSDTAHRLALYPENQTHSPIAYYKKIEDPPTLALVLRSAFEHIRVEVITSFIMLEHRLRLNERVLEGEKAFGRSGNGVFFVAGY